MRGARDAWGFAWAQIPDFLDEVERAILKERTARAAHRKFDVNGYGPRWEWPLDKDCLSRLFDREATRMGQIASVLGAHPDTVKTYEPHFFNSVVRSCGMELEPHTDVDKSRYPGRRCAIIVYLNCRWDPAWGGAFVLHARSGKPSVVIEPQPRSAVIMEVNGLSRHSVEPILRGKYRHAIVGWLHDPLQKDRGDAVLTPSGKPWVPGRAVDNL